MRPPDPERTLVEVIESLGRHCCPGGESDALRAAKGRQRMDCAVISEFEVSDEHAGWRLDRILTASVSSLSRSLARRLVEEGSVTLDGVVIDAPASRPEVGSIIRVVSLIDEVPPALPAPENIPLDVLFEDDDMLVIAKAAGMVVHPGAGNDNGTLVNALVWRYGAGGEGFSGRFIDSSRPGIVHRLDKGTSGCLVVAKHQRALDFLKKAFKKRVVEKIYLAVVSGRPRVDCGVVDAPLARHPAKRLKMAVMEGGKEAVTHWEVVCVDGVGEHQISLLKVRLETGRKHQIRVHMASIGHPVVGDSVYGGKRWRSGELLQRMMLHSWRLALPIPSTRETREFVAPIPRDMRDFMENRGLAIH